MSIRGVETVIRRGYREALAETTERIGATVMRKKSSYLPATADYPSADRIGKRIVFNIGGNKYRLIVGYHFPSRVLYVKWFGTHAAYNKIDVATVEYNL